MTDSAVGGLGIGTPVLRYALLLVALLYTVNGIATGYLGAHNVMGFGAYALGAFACLLLTEQGEHRLAPLRIAAVLGCTLLAATIVIVTDTSDLRSAAAFQATLLILAVLAIRGHMVAAWFGAGASVAVGVGWALVRDIPVAERLPQFVPPAALVWACLWRWLALWIAERERTYRTDAAQAEFAAQLAREAERRTVDELGLVRDEAADVLSRLREGLAVEQIELVMTEASIRDRIRAPQLQTKQIRRAVHDARLRGVRVVEMGHDSDPGQPISGRLDTAVAEIVNQVESGEVTIRALPARRAAALTVLVETAGRHELHLLDEDGEPAPNL
ncbi:hypothetical protein [Micropruina sp.]|uniref:hypothetical protein n=1 Tax=Micropruina sp. TaxID=2737536 RepID=UPI0039E4104E